MIGWCSKLVVVSTFSTFFGYWSKGGGIGLLKLIMIMIITILLFTILVLIIKSNSKTFISEFQFRLKIIGLEINIKSKENKHPSDQR